VQTRIRIFGVVAWVACFGGAWFLGEWMRRDHIVFNQTYAILGLVVLVCANLLLQKYWIPRLAQVRIALPAEQLGFPLSGAYGISSDSRDGHLDAKSEEFQPSERR
jgi:hypothetical protein